MQIENSKQLTFNFDDWTCPVCGQETKPDWWSSDGYSCNDCGPVLEVEDYKGPELVDFWPAPGSIRGYKKFYFWHKQPRADPWFFGLEGSAKTSGRAAWKTVPKNLGSVVLALLG